MSIAKLNRLLRKADLRDMNMNFINAMQALSTLAEDGADYLEENKKYILEHIERVQQFADWLVENLPELTQEAKLVDENNTMELREDVAIPSLSRDDILMNAPQAAAGCIVMPKVVE